MTPFSDDEIQVRIDLVTQIVQAAFSIRGRMLCDAELQQHTLHWAAALGRVATPQLREVYHAGLEQQCETAEAFLAAWEAKIEAQFRAAQHKRVLNERRQADSKTAVVPEFILKSWEKKR